MGARLRVLRRQIRSVQSTKKITRAMEMVATSRIGKAKARTEAARPYSAEITRALTALASSSTLEHPLLQERPQPRRAGVLVITSDRGLAGAYSANAVRRAGELGELLREEGKEPVLYVVGRKGVAYYRFRGRPMAGEWTGFSEQPSVANARDIGQTLVRAFQAGADDTDDTDGGSGADGVLGVDELHIVYTQFRSMISQVPAAVRIAPMVVEETDAPPPGVVLPLYEFEPEPEALLEAMLPKYVNTRIYAALLESATSESAARRRACKAATDNAEELIKTYTREANQARQAEITQEISEIVGTADALASQ
ncbi:MAG TPA: F0F1 ATP synthase subunit gamma [Mycobacteriales bacterium]|nr:F0F1 ATP synthase subunit gamma [Mycobacteriales bacterium]